MIDGFEIDTVCEYGFSRGLKVYFPFILSCEHRRKIKRTINRGLIRAISLIMNMINESSFPIIPGLIKIEVMSSNIGTI